MLKIPVSHPEILHALGSAGHLSKILISDGHYPHGTHPNPRAKIVWANFRPGLLDAVTVLEMVADLVSIEEVVVMEPHRDGPSPRCREGGPSSCQAELSPGTRPERNASPNSAWSARTVRA